MKTLITLGFVQVETPVVDCEGTRRTIDFPRIGRRLTGTPRYHWTAKKYLAEARKAATTAIANMNAK